MRFALFECPPCERCGERMVLARRTPSGTRPEDSELRTFECLRCGHQLNVETKYDGVDLPTWPSPRHQI